MGGIQLQPLTPTPPPPPPPPPNIDLVQWRREEGSLPLAPAIEHSDKRTPKAETMTWHTEPRANRAEANPTAARKWPN